MNKSSHVPIYRNSKFPAEKRVKDLLKRMTLEEKAAQMMCVWQEQATKLVDDRGKFEQSDL
jgi:beta-glucosidase